MAGSKPSYLTPDLDKVIAGTSAAGIAADSMGSVFAADVGAHNLRKYVKIK